MVKQTIRIIVRTTLILFALLASLAVLNLLAFCAALHLNTEGKIKAALRSRHPGAQLSIRARTEWGYDNQICFDVELLHPRSGQTQRKIVMVNGDSDGGTWRYGREFASMAECEKSFNRG